MHTKLTGIATIIAIIMLSCKSPTNGNAQAQQVNSDSTYPPVETKAPNTDYKPALKGKRGYKA